MKKSAPLFIAVVATITLWACNSKSKPPQGQATDGYTENPAAEEPFTCVMPGDSNFTLAQVTSWIAAWDSVIVGGDSNMPGQAASFRTFETEQLKTFLGHGDNVSSDSVLRIYFGLSTALPESMRMVPDLYMVLGTPCSEDTNVLASRLTNSQELSCSTSSPHYKEAKEAVSQYWTNLKTYPRQNNVEYRVKSYTFNLDSVRQLADEDKIGFVPVYFGMHNSNYTVDPRTDLLFDVVFGLQDDTKARASTIYLDFAQPCPDACDTTSALYLASQ